MEEMKPEDQSPVEKENAPEPTADSTKKPQTSSAVRPTPEQKNKPSKAVQYLRTGLIWLGVIAVAFLAGILTYHFARFRPVETSLVQTSQNLEGLQARSDELTDQLKTANRNISTLESELDAAKTHIELLQALADINTAHIALSNQDVAGAKVALSNTAQRFETLKPSIASVDSALAENIGQRLDLINTSMENDPETAMADLGLLAKNLQNVETLLFGN